MSKKKKTDEVPLIAPAILARNKAKLGTWLKARRTELGRTLREAAAAGHCSDAWLCQLETASCDVAAVQVGSLPKLSAAYKLPVDAIFDTILRALGYQRAPQA